MKLLLIGSIALFSNLVNAGPTITPMSNERASVLVEKNEKTIKIINQCKDSKLNTRYNPCKYNVNDYRITKSSEVGCAYNTNRKNSNTNGKLCN
ncbi:hypothetical protein [Yersinia hibernica]|uniref:Uncharacterized protein n=1 Tax=Yersinia enterocolitica LC20 TaxID=1443113 RepID=A0A7U4K012_YEREN|nr:hypothetical protein [Yersinia hibernica]AHM72017.1 hypothetical protein LC20_00761 [Yersinia hibernica]OVZ94328.1 hypothetical protein CBW54_01910 [Yersinia kristensenii]